MVVLFIIRGAQRKKLFATSKQFLPGNWQHLWYIYISPSFVIIFYASKINYKTSHHIIRTSSNSSTHTHTMSEDEFHRKHLDETLRVGFDTPTTMNNDEFDDLEGSETHYTLHIDYGDYNDYDSSYEVDNSSVISFASVESDNWLDFDIGTGIKPPLVPGTGHGECPICLGEILVMAGTSCGHHFCYTCLSDACKQIRNNSSCCPECRAKSFCPLCRQEMTWGRAWD